MLAHNRYSKQHYCGACVLPIAMTVDISYRAWQSKGKLSSVLLLLRVRCTYLQQRKKALQYVQYYTLEAAKAAVL